MIPLKPYTMAGFEPGSSVSEVDSMSARYATLPVWGQLHLINTKMVWCKPYNSCIYNYNIDVMYVVYRVECLEKKKEIFIFKNALSVLKLSRSFGCTYLKCFCNFLCMTKIAMFLQIT
jgi:hypothetical protein